MIKTNLPCYQHQQGAVLIMSLILLVVLTFVGISALDNSKLQTRMAANTKTSNCAFQVANTGLDQLFKYYSPQAQRENLSQFPPTFQPDSGFPSYSDGAGVATIESMQLNLGGSSNSSSNNFLVRSQGTCDNHPDHHVTLLEGWRLEGADDPTNLESPQSSLNVPTPLCNNGLNGKPPTCPAGCTKADVDNGVENECSPWHACYAKYYPDDGDDDENTDLGDAETCEEAIANRCSVAQKVSVGCKLDEEECGSDDSSQLKTAICDKVPSFCKEQESEQEDIDGVQICVALLSAEAAKCDDANCWPKDEEEQSK